MTTADKSLCEELQKLSNWKTEDAWFKAGVLVREEKQ